MGPKSHTAQPITHHHLPTPTTHSLTTVHPTYRQVVHGGSSRSTAASGHRHTHSLTHWLARSVTHPPARPLTRPLTHSPAGRVEDHLGALRRVGPCKRRLGIRVPGNALHPGRKLALAVHVLQHEVASRRGHHAIVRGMPGLRPTGNVSNVMREGVRANQDTGDAGLRGRGMGGRGARPAASVGRSGPYTESYTYIAADASVLSLDPTTQPGV